MHIESRKCVTVDSYEKAIAILVEGGAHREPEVCEGCFLRKAIAILAESGAHRYPKVCEGCFLRNTKYYRRLTRTTGIRNLSRPGIAPFLN